MNTKRAIHYIDDDKDDLDTFQFAVEQMNIPVKLHTHTNPQRFMEVISEECRENPLVFLDVNMPDKSGFELLVDIRKKLECKEVPVIMFSTSDDPNSILVSKDLGANHYVVKPNSLTALKDIIRKLAGMDIAKINSRTHDFVLSF